MFPFATIVNKSVPTIPLSPNKNQPRDIPIYKSLIFSGVSGAIATTCIYPIDLTKTKLQEQRTKPRGVTGGATYKGPIDCFIKIIRSEGLRGIYRGWPPNVVLVMPEKALKLTLNDLFRAAFTTSGASSPTLMAQMCAGGLAGFIQVIATNPMELLKIKGATQLDKFNKGEITEILSYTRLSRTLGLSGVYAGVVSTWMRDVPFSVVYFTLYSVCKAALNNNNSNNTGSNAFIAGSIAGTVAAGLSTPLDVIKTRVHSKAEALKPNEKFWAREFTMIRKTYADLIMKEGSSALFKGVIPRCMIISPLFAITMTCFEFFKENFA